MLIWPVKIRPSTGVSKPNCVERVWLIETDIWDKRGDSYVLFLFFLSHTFLIGLSSLTILYFWETKLWRIFLCRLVCYLILRRLRYDRRVDEIPVRSPSTGSFYLERKSVEPCVPMWVTVFSKASPLGRLDQIRFNIISLFLFLLLAFVVYSFSWILCYDFNWHVNQYN